MNIDQWESKMILALEGELSETEYQHLVEEIKNDATLLSIWNSYEVLYEEMETVPQEIPSAIVKNRFEGWLAAQEIDNTKIVDIAQNDTKKRPLILWRRWAGAAAVLLCVFGFWKVYEYNQNVQSQLADVGNQMAILMEQQSSTERIKAIRVNYSPSANNIDDKMIQVLIDVLYEDKSSNVRLAAVETLAHYMDEDKVREALIKRLSEESDGGVKLSIITSLSQQQDENFKSTLENIVNDDSQEKFVIDEAHMQLIRFDKIDI